MSSRGQTRFQPLRLTGRENLRTAPTDRLCNLPGCNKYIDAGSRYIRWNTFDLHVSCATDWCNINGVDVTEKWSMDG